MLDGQISRLVELAADLDDLADKLKTLKTCPTKIRRDFAIARANLSAEEIRERVLAKMLDLRSVLSAAPVKARTAVEALLDGARFAVHQDADRGFRVEGTLILELETTVPRKAETPSRAPVSCGSGGLGCIRHHVD